MVFRIDRDRMHVVWSDGAEDLALALLSVEGFELARNAGSPAEKFRTAYGCWERRIVYVSTRRDRERARRIARIGGATIDDPLLAVDASTEARS